ncbi:MAG TPA: alanine--tRNA ligase [Acidimicrobiales bacterium]|jgi:alanyl-tRNA synthetase|nr:alanine--tRNA ligase [Acidimicrobiales bacterium]
MQANALRRAFTDFFVEHGHVVVPSAGLIPHHRLAPLFTNAGMNQFIPYFLGEEVPTFRRATTVQKCVRIRGKHDDIELVGRTSRHLTFFEMLGNFSFGDYFKPEAITWAWELLTGRLGLDGDRLWASVYTDDDVAAGIWRDSVGVPAERIVRMGEDNFWEMGDTGPCGPSSEIYYDRGPAFGDEGGPAKGGEERYVEIWNLVFTQFDRRADGSLVDLPRPNIDTGAGFERLLTVLQDVPSIWETDVVRPLIARAESLCGRTYGDDTEVDVALRILADHARSISFLISDGVFPSNEDRGYVLRRLIRRAVRQAFQLGVERPVTRELVGAVVSTMGDGYPDLARNAEFVAGVAAREEERFGATLRSGLAILESELAAREGEVSGDVAFRLHDTHGFPVELTREIAAERGGGVDEAGFEAAMDQQRRRAREAGKGQTGVDPERVDAYRELLEQFGPTRFVGYTLNEAEARVLAVIPDGDRVEIFLDTTPFYAEGGGQVGDTGTITTPTGTARVLDTTAALPGVSRHLAVIQTGTVTPGQTALAAIDAGRRASIRRNHTGTHLLHWALRQVLGDHVKQQGSLVAPDRLRFDFTHYGALSGRERAQVEDLVNDAVLGDEPVVVSEVPRAEADRSGAIAFFDEKYGETVRVIRAGSASIELCGGTHVERLGMIGPLEITSESSIGSNIRRVEATTGTATLARLRQATETIAEAAGMLKASPEELTTAIERRLADLRAAEEGLKAARRAGLATAARALAELASADGGVVVGRHDGVTPDALRDLALQVKAHDGVRTVVLGGAPETGKVALVAAVAKGEALAAPALIGDAARIVGGGGGGRNPELAMAGGRDPSRLDEALDQVRGLLGLSAP